MWSRTAHETESQYANKHCCRYFRRMFFTRRLFSPFITWYGWVGFTLCDFSTRSAGGQLFTGPQRLQLPLHYVPKCGSLWRFLERDRNFYVPLRDPDKTLRKSRVLQVIPSIQWKRLERGRRNAINLERNMIAKCALLILTARADIREYIPVLQTNIEPRKYNIGRSIKAHL